MRRSLRCAHMIPAATSTTRAADSTLILLRCHASVAQSDGPPLRSQFDRANPVDARRTDAIVADFQTHGWVRIPAAFSADEAAAMRDVVWRALADVGIARDDPRTWTKERPHHLQHLKSNPVFRAVGSHRTVSAINAVLHPQRWRMPSDWGAFFIVFPTYRPWDVPWDGWHVDAG